MRIFLRSDLHLPLNVIKQGCLVVTLVELTNGLLEVVDVRLRAISDFVTKLEVKLLDVLQINLQHVILEPSVVDELLSVHESVVDAPVLSTD